MIDYAAAISQLLSKQTNREADQDMHAWFNRFKLQTVSISDSVERAMFGGRTSENVAYAFAAGYQSAIEKLFGLKDPLVASLCVTEAEGNHPRAIKTLLSPTEGGYLLNGQKNFVSGGPKAGFLYVACKVGESESGLPELKVVGIPADVEGVQIKALPTLPFIPEVSHGAVSFDKVFVSEQQIMPGDGYADYVKPFRTMEDLHVLSAILAFRLGEAIESGWSPESIESHLSLVLSMLAFSNMDYRDPSMHVTFASCRERLKSLIELTDDEYEKRNPEGFEAWKRDRKLLRVAEKAHEIRTAKAWDSLGLTSENKK